MAEQAATVEDRIQSYLEAEEAPPQEEQETQEVQEEAQTEPVQEQQEAKPEEEESVELTSIADLAELEGLSMEDMYTLTVPVTMADGQKKEISLGEWKDAYQATDLVRAEREAIAKERLAFDNEAKQRKEELDASFFQAAKILELAEKQLHAELDPQRLREIRENDPAEYAAIQSDHRDRVKALETQKAELANEYRTLKEKQNQEYEQKYQQFLAEAQKKLPEIIPEWRDESVAAKEVADIRAFAPTVGFTVDEVNGIPDPRVLSVFRMAMLYAKQQQAKPEVKKRVVTVAGKVLRGGKSKSKTERNADVRLQDRKAVKKAGTTDAFAAYINKHMLGDM